MERDVKGRGDGAASQRPIWLTALIYPHAYHDGMEMTVWINAFGLRETHTHSPDPSSFLALILSRDANCLDNKLNLLAESIPQPSLCLGTLQYRA